MRVGASGGGGRVSGRDDAEARAARLEKEAHELTTQLAFLEEEVAMLRRRLTDSPRALRQLEERLAEAQSNLSGVVNQNERLVGTLKEAREQIVALKEEIDRLAQPPSGYGYYLCTHEDGSYCLRPKNQWIDVGNDPAEALRRRTKLSEREQGHH